MINIALKRRKFKSLGTRIVLFVLIFSSFFTFLATSLQTYFDFQHDFDHLKMDIEKLDNDYLRGLTYAIWTLDENQVDVLLKSLIRKPEIVFLRLKGTKGKTKEFGKRVDSTYFSFNKTIDLKYRFLNKDEILGQLYIEVDTSNVYLHRVESLGLVLLANGVKTFIVAFFMLFIFRRIVTKPLENLVEYTRSLSSESLNGGSEKLETKNEIDMLSHSITELYKNLEKSFTDILNKEERFRDLAEFKKQTIWETDSNFFVTFTSLKNEKEVLGKKIIELYPFNVEPKKLIDKINQEKSFRDFRYEFNNKCWEISAKPFFDEDSNNINGFRFITRDNTEKWQLEIENEQNKEKFRQVQKLDSIGRLSSGLTHDFNNLLMIISGSLRSLKRGKYVNNDGLRYLDSAKSAVDRGSKITRKLMSFSRKQPFDARDENVNHLLNGMFDLIEKCLNKEINLTIDMEKEVSKSFIDASEFENACINMAVNARDAMPKGGTLHIKTLNVTKEKDHYVKVSFSDTGMGMEDEVAARIFEPFYTTKEIGKGTGLGLSQLYGFVKESNGFIEVDSKVGKGTKISLFLPHS